MKRNEQQEQQEQEQQQEQQQEQDEHDGDSNSVTSSNHLNNNNNNNNNNGYDEENHSDIEMDELNSFDQLLFEDDAFDDVEDDLINTLLNYTKNNHDSKRYLELFQKNNTDDTDDDNDEKEKENENTIESPFFDEITEEEEENKDEDNEINNNSNNNNDDIESNNNEDIDSKNGILKRSLAESILKSPVKVNEIEMGNLKFSKHHHHGHRKIKSTTSSPPSSSSWSSCSTSSKTLKSPILKSDISFQNKVKRVKRFVISPKILIEINNVEYIREDICAIDRLLAGYTRTGITIVGLGVGLISKLGFTTKVFIVSLIYFIYGVLLIGIGILRCRVAVKYIKKGYMRPSVISILAVEILTIFIVGISFYVIL